MLYRLCFSEVFRWFSLSAMSLIGRLGRGIQVLNQEKNPINWKAERLSRLQDLLEKFGQCSRGTVSNPAEIFFPLNFFLD
jgi:hypothetical protein